MTEWSNCKDVYQVATLDIKPDLKNESSNH